MKKIRFTVAGTGRFPIDMLRYDSCYPVSGEDAGKIATSYEGPRERKELGRYEVELETCSPGAPTTERWNSFMWGVVDCERWSTEKRLLTAVGARRRK